MRYGSLADLSDDHASYLTHGGAIIPWTEAPPKVNSDTLIRFQVPFFGNFDFPSRVVRVLDDERGFMVAFDTGARASRLALDALVVSDDFKERVSREDPATRLDKVVRRFSIEAPEPPVVPRPLDVSGDAPEEEVTPVEAPAPRAPKQKAPEVVQLADPDADEVVDVKTDVMPALLNEDVPPTPEYDLESEPKQEAFPVPGPGETYAVYVMRWAALIDFADLADAFAKTARIRVPHPNDPGAAGDLAQLRLQLPGNVKFHMYAVIEEVSRASVELRVSPSDPAFQNATAYPRTLAGQKRRESEGEADRRPVEVLRLTEERTGEAADSMPIRRRLQRMGMDEKINLAQSGDREERMALAMDSNKAIHHYLLKNARISLDEIAFMARLPNLNPDVLNKIGENPAYTQNQTVVKHLVYNPKTPVALAIRLLDRLPRSEIMQIAKRTSMNQKLVMAAKKKIEK